MRFWNLFRMTFAAIGKAFEDAHDFRQDYVGKAETRLIEQRALVDFAVSYMEQHR